MYLGSYSINRLRERVMAHMDSLKDPSHDGNHIRRVEEKSQLILDHWRLSPTFQFDGGTPLAIIAERVSLLALLHDTIDTKYFDGDPVGMISSLTKDLIFESTNFEDKDQCKMMIRIMQKARWSNHAEVNEQTPNYGYIAILSDADWLDAIGVIGIFRTIAYNTLHWVPNGPNDTPMKAVVRHYNEKLVKIPSEMHTEYSYKLALDCFEAMKDYFKLLECKSAFSGED